MLNIPRTSLSGGEKARPVAKHGMCQGPTDPAQDPCAPREPDYTVDVDSSPKSAWCSVL